jgi:hypothetical protein
MSSQQGDIRRYLSPLQQGSDAESRHTPTVAQHGNDVAQPLRRRRRILTSDDDVPMVQQLHLDDNTAERQAGSPNISLPQAIVQVDSSTEESSDDMWVQPRRAQSPPALLSTPEHQQCGRPRHPADTQRPEALPRAGRSPRRQQPQRRRQRRRMDVEAAESSAVTDDSECIETDTDAADLYRSAIRNVRGARQARQQQRTQTEHCPVCAKFASYLEHFI